MESTQIIEIFGSWPGLVVYILLKDLVPFLRDKWWPQQVAEQSQEAILRRAQDAQFIDLREREVVAQEHIATSLTILTERVGHQERLMQLHSEQTLTLFAKVSNSLGGLRADHNLLVDRLPRTPNQ